MTTGLYYKVRGVRNCLCLLLLLVYWSGSAQSFASKKISLSLQNATLHEVIDQLSLATGLYFIYSPDKIKSKGLLNISVSDKTIAETLTSVSLQMNLEFKQQGEYVIVKNNEFGQLIAKADRQIRPELRMRSQSPALTTFFPPLQSAPPRTVRFLQPDSVNRLDKYVKQLQPYFDSTVLRRVPPSYVQRLNKNNKHRGWFVAAGGVVNDYSKGMEIQSGIRSAYFVYTPTWMSSGQFHGAYGLGSSILLHGDFSLHPVYSFSNMNWKYPTEYAIARMMYGPSQLKVTTRHHQVKLMIRYAITKNVVVQAGPTFNRATTHYRFSEMDRSVFKDWIPSFISAGVPASYGTTGSTTNYARPNTIMEIYPSRPTSFESAKSWVGYETSLLIRINFRQP